MHVAVPKGVRAWADAKLSEKMAGIENPNLEWIRVAEERIKVLLDSAFDYFPFICALGCPVPIFCPAFLTDLAHLIQENEQAYIEVSCDIYKIYKYRTNHTDHWPQFFTLIDPHVAGKLGNNKTVHSPLSIVDIFTFYSTMPKTALASKSNALQGDKRKVEDPTTQIEKACG